MFPHRQYVVNDGVRRCLHRVLHMTHDCKYVQNSLQCGKMAKLMVRSTEMSREITAFFGFADLCINGHSDEGGSLEESLNDFKRGPESSRTFGDDGTIIRQLVAPRASLNNANKLSDIPKSFAMRLSSMTVSDIVSF